MVQKSWSTGKYPSIYRVLYIPGGAGFFPSTVLLVSTTFSSMGIPPNQDFIAKLQNFIILRTYFLQLTGLIFPGSVAALGKWKPPFTAGWSLQNVGLGQGVYILYIYTVYARIVLCPDIFKTTKFVSRTYKTSGFPSFFLPRTLMVTSIGMMSASWPASLVTWMKIRDQGQLTSFNRDHSLRIHGTNGIFTYILS